VRHAAVEHHSQSGPVTSAARPRICHVLLNAPGPSETFLTANTDGLPADVHVVYGIIPQRDGRHVLGQDPLRRAVRKVGRLAAGRDWTWEITLGYMRALRESRADVALAEYGPTAVAVLPACERLGVPLVAHFHGFDASRRGVLEEYASGYQRLFGYASGIIAVSRRMEETLLRMGAPRDRLHYRPCGVDCDRFGGGAPADAPATLLAVGRLVEKKAPHLTLLAFAEVLRRRPHARLRIVGDGILMNVCHDLVESLGLREAVTLLGAQPHERVLDEMRRARGFVQHSVEAWDGDCEGTPVSVMEAGATGLPVVATRHAGIADVVLHGETGLLVDERDVSAMAEAMTRLVDEPALAAKLGAAGQERIRSQFSLERSREALWRILVSSFTRSPAEPTATASVGRAATRQ
jgi:glycosyltransferase involved in cell wall biosynthesis